jgi:endonuclease/exonuclease/phosphatase family metal-dependent hydrolase
VRLPLIIVGLLLVACARDPWVADVTTSATPGSEPPRAADAYRWEAGRSQADSQRQPEDGPSYPAAIALDGEFDDWEEIPPLYTDETGDGGWTGIDLGVIKAAHDADYFYLYFEVGEEISLGSDQFLALYLDCDDRLTTGYEYRGIGAELQWIFGQRGGKVYRPEGMTPVQYSDIGFRGGPTVTSDRFEVSFSRHAKVGDAKLLGTGTVAITIADHTWNGEGVEDGDAAPLLGTVLRYYLGEEAPPPMEPVPLGRAAGTLLRVVSWNSLYTGLLDPERAPHFKRILKAVDPDVVCLQEAWYASQTAATLDEWLPLVGGQWQVSDYGNQITLSRIPIEYGWPGGYGLMPENVLQTTVVAHGGARVIIFNAHLAWGDQDEARQRQADAFIAYLRAMERGEAGMDVPEGTPFVFLGDLNLVGDAQQLTTLLTGDIQNEEEFGPDFAPDWDDTPLTSPALLQTERRMGYTWRADSGSYWPGRLDYALLPDSAVQLAGGYLLYTSAMSQEVLAAHGLHADDSTSASDHLPLVLDLTW